MTFKELGLSPKIIKALDDLGYEKPTPIQARAIPAALQNRDVLGIAQTGTGKTGAFVLPTMHKLEKGRARARMPRCLIICPTRELAAQVAENVEQYGKYLKLEMALLIGGVSFAKQDQKLSKGVDILIATPGRLLDQFERGKILMTGVQTLVVDEADRMLDMGFIPDIEKIFKMTPFTRQVLFFSATMPNEIKRLVDQFLHQPVSVQIARKNMTAKTVTQRIIRMPSSDHKQKRTAIRYIIENEDIKSGIIFCNRKRDVDIVAKSLTKHGYNADPIHGDLAQSLRTETLDRFREGKIRFLVASDVAARGLDVPEVSHVINYDVPNHSEDYVHRIGRTGRAGRKGDAIMLVARLDEQNYRDVLSLIKMEAIEEMVIPGIEDFPKDSGGRNRKGGRDRKGGGRDRNSKDRGGRDRNRGSNRNARSDHSDDKLKSRAPKTEAPKSEKPVAEKPKKPVERRRKAPGRKPLPEAEAPKAKSEERKPRETKNHEGKPRNDKPHENKSRDRKPREDRPDKKPKQKSDRNASERKNGGKKEGRNRNNRDRNNGKKGEPKKADKAGFGDSVPDFFKSSL